MVHARARALHEIRDSASGGLWNAHHGVGIAVAIEVAGARDDDVARGQSRQTVAGSRAHTDSTSTIEVELGVDAPHHDIVESIRVHVTDTGHCSPRLTARHGAVQFRGRTGNSSGTSHVEIGGAV